MHLCFKMRYPCMDATFSNMITECVKTNDGLIQHTYSFGLNFYFLCIWPIIPCSTILFLTWHLIHSSI